MSVKCVLRCFAVGSVSLAFGAVDPLDALVGIFEQAPVTLQAPDRTSQAAGAIVQRLGAQGPGVSPHAGAALDPDSHHARAACDKDFSQQCPLLFSPAGVGNCAPTAAYVGPCAGSVQSFDGLSSSAKERWSELCVAHWPCVECRRDFSSLCPGDWVSDGGTKCKPTASYIGPCISAMNFAGFTRGMVAEKSSTCGAYWPCLA